MNAADIVILPTEPQPVAPASVSWTVAIMPVALSLVFFAVTKSPVSLVLAGVMPLVMLSNVWVKRRSERKRFARETAAFENEVINFDAQVREMHRRERDSWLRKHPNASILGTARQPSRVRVDGPANSPRLRELALQAATNELLPVAVECQNTGTANKLQLNVDGNLARQLSHRFAVVDSTRARSGASNGPDADVIRLTRHHGQLLLNDETVLRVRLEPHGKRTRRPTGPELASAALRELGDAGDPRTSLVVTLGRDADGNDVTFDLVSQGPHALIAGTTGSGKSELLQTLVAQLLSRYPPRLVQFLLLDFKGGASLQHLAGFPHVLELLSDLDAHRVARVVSGLSAEIRRRERLLRDQKCSDVAQLDTSAALARLVIVVDEFAALVNEHPELHATFVDISARGRALGMHLIIATQRPTGSVRDALSANCGLKFCLRVTSAAESVAVIGADASARFAPTEVGMCVHAHNGFVAKKWHVSQTSVEHLSKLMATFARTQRESAAWLPPLPETLSIEGWDDGDDGDDDRLYVGLADHPEQQQQPRVTISARDCSPLLVFGSQRSGKTNVCELLAQQWQRVGSTELREMYFVAGRSDALWDALAMARRSDQSGRLNSCKTLWIFDDLDVAMSGLSPEHAAAAANEFVRLVQDRPDSDLVVATGSRLPAQLATQLAGVANRLYLRAANKDQHVNWGLPLVTYRADAPAGRAIFRGLETQVAHSERQQPRFVSACASIPTDELLAVVTSRHDEWRGGVFFNHEQWRVQLVNEVPLPNQSAFSGRTVVLGEPEDWIGNPMTVTQLRSTATFLFDRTSPAEVRQITRRSALPPPVFEPDQALLWRKGGGFRRLRLARHPKQ